MAFQTPSFSERGPIKFFAGGFGAFLVFLAAPILEQKSELVAGRLDCGLGGGESRSLLCPG
jgi:hypothetical protein